MKVSHSAKLCVAISMILRGVAMSLSFWKESDSTCRKAAIMGPGTRNAHVLSNTKRGV
jgi:hypothetical protein